MEESSKVTTGSPEAARAEEMLVEASEKVGAWASKLSLEVLKRVARAREEAEDMWAEAQELKRSGQRPPSGDHTP